MATHVLFLPVNHAEAAFNQVPFQKEVHVLLDSISVCIQTTAVLRGDLPPDIFTDAKDGCYRWLCFEGAGSRINHFEGRAII